MTAAQTVAAAADAGCLLLGRGPFGDWLPCGKSAATGVFDIGHRGKECAAAAAGKMPEPVRGKT